MFRFVKAAFATLLVISLNLPLAAQSDTQQKKPRNEKSSAAKTKDAPTFTQRRALEVLDQLFDAAKALNDEPLKLKLQGQIADALWEYDEERARTLFEAVFRAITALKAPAGDNRPGASVDSSQQSSLRYELLTMMMQRDVSLARRLMDSLPSLWPPDDADPALKRLAETNRTGLYLSLARDLARTNPQRAVEIAEPCLQGNVVPTFTVLLYELQRQDEHSANYLFNRLLTAFYDSPQKPRPHFTTLALYALPGYGDINERRNFIQMIDPTISLIANPLNQAQLERAQRLLNYVYDILMQPVNSHYTNYDLASQTLFYFEQYLPDKVASARARMDEAMSLFPPEQRRNLRGPALPQTMQSILAAAEAATNQKEKERLSGYVVAEASSKEDFDQAFSIVEKITDKQGRASLQSGLQYRATLAAIGRGDFETAYTYSKGITGMEMRIMIFAKLARALYQNKNATRALEIINEVEQSLVKADPGPEQVIALLNIAGVAAEIDAARGFEITKSAVEAINRADKALNQNSNAAAVATMNRLNFEPSFSALARANFDRALLLAQSLEKREFVVRAQLAVCRGVLIALLEAKAKETEKSEKEQQKAQPDKTKIKKTGQSE